ncbi:probable helicase MAGATAMA 3 isoform X1 [Amborella trichopoda]|nr:probable helicase MAGATAMA 3 isoform X1 [Amborella trichopoda]|eukprot:XP_006847151.2 probable helicase MAGATAMA 3 isoform X1 [Amborella trichopoda]
MEEALLDVNYIGYAGMVGMNSKEALEKAILEASQQSRFQKIVLSWDYLHVLENSEKNKQSSKVSASWGLKNVKETFKDVEEYIGIFEPLLFEEVKADIVKGLDEDEVMEWQMGAVASCEEANEFHAVTLLVKEEVRDKFSENDLLLLSKEKFREGMPLLSAYGFAMVEGRPGRDTLKLRTYHGGEFDYLNTKKIVSSTRLSNMLSALKAQDSVLWVLKISSLSTITREYSALHSIGSLPFADLILSASEKSKTGDPEHQTWNVPRPLMDSLVDNHNQSQLEAIQAGLSRRTFVLIQGPPGTGKTQTILGLLSATLHSAPTRVQSKGVFSPLQHRAQLTFEDKSTHWMKASPWLSGSNPRDLIMPVDGDDGFFPTTGNELKPEVVASNRKYRVHVLVCAPSNSALDEIVLRLLNTGLRDENDNVYNPKIVRIGLKPHHSIQAVSMDYLVEQKMATMDRSSIASQRGGSATLERDRIRASILDEAAIVFSTLSFSGSNVFSRMSRRFDVVIIDEAAQAVEPATLVPLAHGCKQVFLVGDPIQLPATVISTTAKKHGYDMSLFERFQKAGYPVHMLKTQYRMHPEIRNFPSKEFYSQELDDGPDMEERTTRKWHDYFCFGPFSFFHIDGVESQPLGSGSRINVDEVEFILLLYHELVSRYSVLKSSSQMAVISPYRHQVKLLRERFRETFGSQSDQLVDINTIDGFQGREKDVVIFSCVRSNVEKGIGFVADYRRMNVGITRARSSILVVGSASALIQDEHWRNLIISAKDRERLFQVSKPYSEFFTEENLKTMIVVENKLEEQDGMQPSSIYDELLMGGQGTAEVEEAHDMDAEPFGYDGGYDED